MRLFSTREGYNLSNEIAHIRNQCNDCFYVPVNFANSETLQAKLSLLIAVSLSAKKEKNMNTGVSCVRAKIKTAFCLCKL